MTQQMFEIKVTATGEVRDADGNLLSAEPVEAVMQVSADQLAEMGIPIPDEE